MTRTATFLALSSLAVSLCLSAAPLRAQIDLEAAERELHTMFIRPAGTPISEEQKDALERFLKHYESEDLQHLSYAYALHPTFR